jgi:hypothetical protein
LDRALVILAAGKIADPTGTTRDTAKDHGAMPDRFISGNTDFSAQRFLTL